MYSHNYLWEGLVAVVLLDWIKQTCDSEPCSYFPGHSHFSWEGEYPLLNPSTFNVYSTSASLNHSEHHIVGTYPFNSNTIELSINLMSYSIP